MNYLLVASLALWPSVRKDALRVRPDCVGGVVVAVTSTTITLSTPEYTYKVKRLVPEKVIPGARRQRPDIFVWEVRTIPAQPRRGMFVSRELRRGGLGRNTDGMFYRYRFRDVRVGDVVSVSYERQYGVMEVVTAIEIKRRPGGHIPPCPTEPAALRQDREYEFRRGKRLDELEYGLQPYHMKVNALEDWESFGIPIPHHLHPGGPQAAVAPPPRRAARPAPP